MTAFVTTNACQGLLYDGFQLKSQIQHQYGVRH
jgi:hypothetical protein